MAPDLLSIGSITIHTYGLLAVAGIIIAFLVALDLGKTQGLSTQKIMDMGFVALFSAALGSRLFYVLMNFPHYSRYPLDALKIWQGGLVFSGGLLTAILAITWYGRRQGLSPLLIGDLWAPAASIGQAVGDLGCLAAGCCYGKPTHAPWGIVFTDPNSLAPTHLALHPSQIYSSVSGAFIFLTLLLLSSKKMFTGQVFLWFLILHSFSQLFLDRFRGDYRGMFLNTPMTITQSVSLLLLTSSVVAVIVLSLLHRESSPPSNE
jgi:phosphatidylglycerol---prolipoprotein diacylglyceryl transferase